MEYNIFIILSMVAFLAVLGAMYLSQSARRQLREEGLTKENEEIKNKVGEDPNYDNVVFNRKTVCNYSIFFIVSHKLN